MLFPTLLLVSLFVGNVAAVAWDSSNAPNPTTQAGAKQCGLRSAGNLCDPDNVLSEGERYRINHELSRLESKTYQEFGRSFCEKKGIVGVILLVKNVKGGTEADVRRMATELKQRWNLDAQCMKSFVIVVSIDDRKFWISRDPKVPVYGGEFNDILAAQNPKFREKNYQEALLNIIQETSNKALSKQGQLPAAPADDGRQPSPPSGGFGKGGDAGGGSGMPFKIPKIPLWVILAIVLVVIPTLICCCICYCCCCRNKGGNRRQGPSDEDPENPRPVGGGGGMGNQFRSLLGGAGGGALMSMFQNCFRNRGHGAGPAQQPDLVGGGGGARGGYIPPRPNAEEGKGLYPSKTVEDEGAGGGW